MKTRVTTCLIAKRQKKKLTDKTKIITCTSTETDITEYMPTMILHMPATRLTVIFNVSKFQFLTFDVQNDIMTLEFGLIDKPILPSI